MIAKRYSAPSAGAAADGVAKNLGDVQRYLAAQPMMNDVISRHLGFRGYGLMMRLQRAGNLRDLHDLLPDVAKALITRIGFEPAKAIVDELERMITSAPNRDDQGG